MTESRIKTSIKAMAAIGNRNARSAWRAAWLHQAMTDCAWKICSGPLSISKLVGNHCLFRRCPSSDQSLMPGHKHPSS